MSYTPADAEPWDPFLIARHADPAAPQPSREAPRISLTDHIAQVAEHDRAELQCRR
jgi:hypothetical protein